MRRRRPTCSTCGANLGPLYHADTPNEQTPASVCLVCDAPDPRLTIHSLGGMDRPAPGER